MKTMDDFDFSGKTVLIRSDLNSPVIKKQVQDDRRIKESCRTYMELIEKNAKVVILAHQGRPGDKDFTRMAQHSKLISKHLDKEVKYVKDVYGEEAINEIKNMNEGDVILLENTKTIPEELAKKTPEEFVQMDFIKNLSSVCDIYINDAFSVSHHGYASIIGFPSVMDSCVGRLMKKEMDAISKIKNPEKPLTAILGGAKPEDSITLIENMEADNFLTGGIISQLFMIAKGIDIGKSKKFLEKNDYLKFVAKMKELLDKKSDKIIVPSDVNAGNEFITNELPIDKEIKDIGKNTIDQYIEIIDKSKTVIMNGPMGVIEEQNYRKGTRKIMEAIEKSDSFSLLGGGHTVECLELFEIDENKISHVSLSGGAMLNALSGKTLPGIEILEK